VDPKPKEESENPTVFNVSQTESLPEAVITDPISFPIVLALVPNSDLLSLGSGYPSNNVQLIATVPPDKICFRVVRSGPRAQNGAVVPTPQSLEAG